MGIISITNLITLVWYFFPIRKFFSFYFLIAFLSADLLPPPQSPLNSFDAENFVKLWWTYLFNLLARVTSDPCILITVGHASRLGRWSAVICPFRRKTGKKKWKNRGNYKTKLQFPLLHFYSHLLDRPGNCSFDGDGTRLSVDDELLAMLCRWIGRRFGLFLEPLCFGGLCGRWECSFPGTSNCCCCGWWWWWCGGDVPKALVPTPPAPPPPPPRFGEVEGPAQKKRKTEWDWLNYSYYNFLFIVFSFFFFLCIHHNMFPFIAKHAAAAAP